MSETFIFHPIKKKSDKKWKKEKILNKILWIVIIVLLLLAVIKILFQFVISPGIKIKHVIINTDTAISASLSTTLSKEEILSIAGIKKNKYYFNLDLKEMQMSLEAVPLVKTAKVEKVFPDTLKLQLYGRTPLAMALVDRGDVTTPAVFDSEGVIFLAGRDIGEWNLPVVSGLRFKGFKTGMKLPKQLESLLKDIELLKRKYGNLYNLISEIEIAPVGSMDFELLLYFIPYNTAVRIGRKITGEQLGYAMMVLNVLDESPRIPGEIDFRTSEVVFKEQGGTGL